MGRWAGHHTWPGRRRPHPERPPHADRHRLPAPARPRRSDRHRRRLDGPAGPRPGRPRRPPRPRPRPRGSQALRPGRPLPDPQAGHRHPGRRPPRLGQPYLRRLGLGAERPGVPAEGRRLAAQPRGSRKRSRGLYATSPGRAQGGPQALPVDADPRPENGPSKELARVRPTFTRSPQTCREWTSMAGSWPSIFLVDVSHRYEARSASLGCGARPVHRHHSDPGPLATRRAGRFKFQSLDVSICASFALVTSVAVMPGRTA